MTSYNTRSDTTIFNNNKKIQPLYNIYNVLSLQKIPCFVLKQSKNQWAVPEYSFDSLVYNNIDTTENHLPDTYLPGYIWIDPIENDYFLADVVFAKGDYVWSETYTIDNSQTVKFKNKMLNGNIVLKLSALLSMYTTKFTGSIYIECMGDTIINIHLKPNSKTLHLYDNSTQELINKHTKLQ